MGRCLKWHQTVHMQGFEKKANCFYDFEYNHNVF